MTPDEFKRWFNDYKVSFPNIAAYLSRVEHPEATFNSWYEVLKKYDIVYLVLVKDQMVYGNLEPLQAHESGLFAHHIRAYVKKMISERVRERDREDVRLPSMTAYIEGDNSTRDLLRWANAATVMCRDAGRSLEQEAEVRRAVIMAKDESASDMDVQKALATLQECGTSLDEVKTYLDTSLDSLLNKASLDEADEEPDTRVHAEPLPERDSPADTGEAPASGFEDSDSPEEPFNW